MNRFPVCHLSKSWGRVFKGQQPATVSRTLLGDELPINFLTSMVNSLEISRISAFLILALERGQHLTMGQNHVLKWVVHLPQIGIPLVLTTTANSHKGQSNRPMASSGNVRTIVPGLDGLLKSTIEGLCRGRHTPKEKSRKQQFQEAFKFVWVSFCTTRSTPSFDIPLSCQRHTWLCHSGCVQAG